MKSKVLARVKYQAAAVLAAASALAATPVSAQQSPCTGSQITIIPFGSAGGVIDVIARYFGERLATRWGQPVIVLNKPGAAGTIAANHVAKAPPDGCTMWLTINVSQVNQPLLNAKIPYDSLRDFRAVGMLGSSSPIFATHPDAPFNTMQEYITWAKANPGATYGSLGAGSTGHMYGQLMQREEGLQTAHVPYKSEAAYISDLIGQRLLVSWVGPGSSAEYSKSGRLKLLGVAGDERTSLIPDLPSFKEQGLEGYNLDTWVGLFVPAGTSDRAVQETWQAFEDIAANSQAKNVIFTAGFDPKLMGPADFSQKFERDFNYTQQLIKELNISLD